MRLIDEHNTIVAVERILEKYGFTRECTVTDEIHDAIENIPTAYDIDKVVEELEEIKGLACDGKSCGECEYTSDCLEGEQSEKVAIDDAIEIVKQGGVADDVCEWKLEDEEANLYLTGCQQRQLIFDGTPKENGYRYCPYCGKKIKVVE